MNKKQAPIRSILALLSLTSSLMAQAGSFAALPRAGAAIKDEGKVDVCALLTIAEVQNVQGEPVKEAKRTADRIAEMQMAQCLFRTVTPAKSVSLALASPDPAAASELTPRQFWRRQFHDGESQPEKHADKNRASRQDQDGESARPLLIAGIGEEAFWVGSSISGALYVLKGKMFLRISVGGVRDEAARRAKSRTLALAAVKRLM